MIKKNLGDRAVDAYRQGDMIDIDFGAGKVTITGKVYNFSQLPEKLVGIFKTKGLVNYGKSNS